MSKPKKYPTPLKIKAKLIEKGVSLTSIAASLDVSVAAVSMTISKNMPSARIKAEIANRLGTTPDKLWRHAA